MEVVPVFASAAATGYEYSSGFVMAINELRISGVLGVVQTPLSRPSIGGTVRLRLELNMVAASFASLLHEIFFHSMIIKMGINFLFSLPLFLLLNSHSLSLFLHSLSHSTCVYYKVVYGVTFTLIKSNILKLTKNNHRSKSSTRLALLDCRVVLTAYGYKKSALKHETLNIHIFFILFFSNILVVKITILQLLAWPFGATPTRVVGYGCVYDDGRLRRKVKV